jgi:hypothetical protein
MLMYSIIELVRVFSKNFETINFEMPSNVMFNVID